MSDSACGYSRSEEIHLKKQTNKYESPTFMDTYNAWREYKICFEFYEM